MHLLIFMHIVRARARVCMCVVCVCMRVLMHGLFSGRWEYVMVFRVICVCVFSVIG